MSAHGLGSGGVCREIQLQVGAHRVRSEGEGPCLVMIHGWPDTSALWDDTVVALRDRYRCVRFDLPGYAPDAPVQRPDLDDVLAQMLAVIDAVSPDAPVTFLLHDWGAVFGYQLAARHPTRVRRVVGLDVGDTFSRAYLASLSAKAKLGIFGYQAWLALAWRLRALGGTRMTRAMARWLRCPAPPEAIGWRMNYPYWMQWTGGFRGARNWAPAVPTLFLYGKRKPAMFHSDRWLNAVAATSGGEAHEMETGHWLMVSGRERYLSLLANWLDRTAA